MPSPLSVHNIHPCSHVQADVLRSSEKYFLAIMQSSENAVSIDLPRLSGIVIPQGAIDLFPRNMGPRILLLRGNEIILKAGPSVKMSEAAAMRFVAERTSIPVPTVYDAYEKDGNGYIFMSRIEGMPLGAVWSTMHEQDQVSILDQLMNHMKELRQITGTFYGALWSSACEDVVFKHFPFTHQDLTYGPYHTRSEYNSGLVEALRNSRPDRVLNQSDELLASKLQSCIDERKVFSHGDIHPRNIIVSNSCRIAGIIDWEVAGFSIPGRDYFEAKSRARRKGWANALDRVFPIESRSCYDDLVELDKALTLYTGA